MNGIRLNKISGLFIAFMLTMVFSTSAVSGQGSANSGENSGLSSTAADPLQIAVEYAASNARQLGLENGDTAETRIGDQYTSQHNGVTHVYLQQQFAGIDVFNAILNINVDGRGQIVSVGNRFVDHLQDSINTTEPALTPVQAVQSASLVLGLQPTESFKVIEPAAGAQREVLLSDGGISLEPIPAKLVYQRIGDGSVRLAWSVTIYELDAQDWWQLRIDAINGKELDRNNLVVHDTFGIETGSTEGRIEPNEPAGQEDGNLLVDDQYRVFAEPVESPSHGGRSLVTNPADPTASPYGWHDTNGAPGAEFTVTRGNNVRAYTDTDANNVPDPNSEPDGGATLVFDFPLNLSQQPSSYRPAAVTNLFYWNNLVHDVFYAYGFDEASGNFQENNYGNGGAGSDSVNAEAQDGGGFNNANFATPSDGFNPRMQMYLWLTTSPMRDGDLDNGIIAHEYGHGISNRLTGGPSTVSCLNNTEQAGEGWSDYFALMMTIEPGDLGTDRRGIGTYALGEPTTGDGIRDYPYSTDMSIDPRTYDAIKSASVPHGVGSTFAAMLWEVSWALIDQYGFDPDLINGTGGNNMALQLVVDGLKLQPCGPGFVDARDAILQADVVNYGGANQCLIWEAFAKRGLGFSASQGSPNNRSDGVEAFDLPPSCQQSLTITKSASPSPVDPGSTLTYSLLVENQTSNSLTGVTVTDNVPADTTYVDGSADCGGSEAGGTVTFPLGSMAPLSSQTCTFQVLVSPGLGSNTFFEDDMESGVGSWSTSAGSGSYNWSLGTANAHSPTHAWYAQDVDTLSDQYLAMTNPVNLTGQAELRFWHDYNTEAGFDGGVVEISVNAGPWNDLGSYITQNGYNSNISSRYGSPIAGRQAFSGNSGGYQETRVDLSSFSGNNVQIRFRMATDSSLGVAGWYLDDVEIVDESSITNTACVTSDQGNNDCDTVVTPVSPGAPTPQINVSPTIIAPTMLPDQMTSETLTIANIGGADLSWNIAESADGCSTTVDLPWTSSAPASGIVSPASSQDVTVDFDSSGLAPGQYPGSLCVSSDDPTNPLEIVSLNLTVQDASSPVDHLATADLPVAGTVAGSFELTWLDDGNPEQITEIDSGRRPSTRFDYLEHQWEFQLGQGSAHTFIIDAWRTDLGDGDTFLFSYSSNGSDYVDMVEVTATTEGTQLSYSLPPALSGTIYVRVRDTDQTPSQNNHESVFIDYMVIQTQPGSPPSGEMHISSLSSGAEAGQRGKWDAWATVAVHNGNHSPLAGVTVIAFWSNGANGSDSCITDELGQCTVTKSNINKNASSVTFTVSDLVLTNYTYVPAANEPPSESIIILAP